MEYAVCEGSNSVAALADAVNAKLSDGWELYGNLVVSNSGPGSWWYYQAVVRGEGRGAEPGGAPGRPRAPGSPGQRPSGAGGG